MHTDIDVDDEAYNESVLDAYITGGTSTNVDAEDAEGIVVSDLTGAGLRDVNDGDGQRERFGADDSGANTGAVVDLDLTELESEECDDDSEPMYDFAAGPAGKLVLSANYVATPRNFVAEGTHSEAGGKWTTKKKKSKRRLANGGSPGGVATEATAAGADAGSAQDAADLDPAVPTTTGLFQETLRRPSEGDPDFIVTAHTFVAQGTYSGGQSGGKWNTKKKKKPTLARRSSKSSIL